MMNFSPFYIAQLPRIVFGNGEFERLPELIREYGQNALLITGRASLSRGSHWHSMREKLERSTISFSTMTVSGEPGPGLIDEAVSNYAGEQIDVVIGIGGGSVIDAAKAIAGLLPHGNSVLDHLEDVGKGLPYCGPSLPLIAVPTTAGTGSEATKNAVLSEQGSQGYKKSFRHECMVPNVALVDPALLESCPPYLMAAQGMDAFTQLLESYVSINANPFTDALAWGGLEAVSQGFMDAYQGGGSEQAKQGRAAMAYGALLSGITLAQVGLGSVHGLAQPFGSLFAIPHGVACGTTVAAAIAVNIEALARRAPDSPALGKYARAGRLFANEANLAQVDACQRLIQIVEEWTAYMKLPRLSEFGITEADLDRIVANSRGNSMKSNPVELSDDEIAEIVRRRL